MRRLSLVPLLVLVLLAACAEAPAPDAGPGLIWDAARLDRTVELWRAEDPAVLAAGRYCLVKADRALERAPYSVVHKTVLPPSGDPHDFYSFSNYYWPNPDTPDGLPYVKRDGYNNPDARVDFDAFVGLSSDLRDLALAYRLTGEAPYAEQAARLARAWFIDPETRMNPSCEHGKVIPGVDRGGLTVTGFHNRFRLILDAVTVLEPSDAWTDADRAALAAWCRDFVDWMHASEAGRHERDALNNHGSSFDALTALLSYYAGDRERAREAVLHYRDHRLADQFAPDGHQPREMVRADNLQYHEVNLRIAFDIARIGDRVGVDLWNHAPPGSGGLRRGLEFLAPYFCGAREWPHFPDESFPARPWSFAELFLRAADAYDEPLFGVLAELVPDVHDRYAFRLLHPASAPGF